MTWWLLGVALVLGGALLTADQVWSLSDRHPVLSSLLTDVVLLLFVAAAVDSVVRHRENARVDEVGRIMYRALAQLAFDNSRRFLALVTGADLSGSGIPSWDAGRTAEVAAVHRQVWPDGSAPPVEDVAGRLAHLLTDHAFARLLYLEVSVFKRRMHDVVSQWAPVLIASGASAEDLRRMRTLADALGVLHQAIYHGAATALPASAWQAPPEWVDATCTAFLDYLRDAERTRAFYHALAEEDRRIGADSLDAEVAVTHQSPYYLAAATREDGD